jgi:mono/diheme cytochrome c family protein
MTLKPRARSFVALLALAWLGTGCKATPPAKSEAAVLTIAKHKLFVGGKEQKNPLAATRDNTAFGQESFKHYCVVCHGVDGQNTGVPFADTMSPPVPLLTSQEVQSYSDGQLKWVIDNGIKPSGMPASKGILTDTEIWSIVVYIRHLPPAGSLGDPLAYSDNPCDASANSDASASR